MYQRGKGIPIRSTKRGGKFKNEIKQKLEIYQWENDCELKKLNHDISNLNKEIAELDAKNQEEISLLKKKILIELNNEYKIKLLKYRNMKELEKGENLNSKNKIINLNLK